MLICTRCEKRYKLKRIKALMLCDSCLKDLAGSESNPRQKPVPAPTLQLPLPDELIPTDSGLPVRVRA